MSKLSKRLAAKASWENRKEHALRCRTVAAQNAFNTDLKVQQSINDNNKKKSKLDRLNITESNREFMAEVERKAPKLLDKEYFDAVLALAKLTRRRDVKDWVPRGKGKMTQFISLAEHTLALYPMPKFIWSVFWDENKEKLIPIVERICGGESLAKMCKAGDFPLPLTKKQCHALLLSPADRSFMKALRQIQVENHGGDIRLFQAWVARDVGCRLHDAELEAFWDSVLAWFCKNPMLDLSQLGPLLDYIQYRRNQDVTFSMKGRSVLAMLRGMAEWHGELIKKKSFEEHNYKPSGFKPGIWEKKWRDKTGCHHYEVWNIDEILTSKDLHKEGSTHKHCVASYGHSIANGSVSIWSMSRNGEKLITIELRNTSRKIVQARGHYNRMYNNEEYKYMLEWAQDNALQISIGRW